MGETKMEDESKPMTWNSLLKQIIGGGIFMCFFTGCFLILLHLRDHLPEFRVDSVTVTSFNTSVSQVTANWDVNFFVSNPNRKSIYYGHMAVSIYHEDEILSDTSIDIPFNQPEKNGTKFQAKFSDLTLHFDEAVDEEIKSIGAVKLNVQILAWIAFDSKDLKMGGTLLKVLCKDLRVGFLSKIGAGALQGGSRICEVSEPSSDD